MKNAFLSFVAACAMAFSAAAQTHVYFDLAAPSFNASPASNRWVTLQALTPFAGNLVNYTSSAAGIFYASNLYEGDYAGVINQKGPASRITFQVSVTGNNLGVIGATNITSVPGVQTYPTAGRSAWSIQADDNRFIQLSNSLYASSGTNLPPSALTNNDTRALHFHNLMTLGNTNGNFLLTLGASSNLSFSTLGTSTIVWAAGVPVFVFGPLAVGVSTNFSVGGYQTNAGNLYVGGNQTNLGNLDVNGVLTHLAGNLSVDGGVTVTGTWQLGVTPTMNFRMEPAGQGVEFLVNGLTMGGIADLAGSGFGWVFSTNAVMNGGAFIGDGAGLTNLPASAQTPWKQDIDGALFTLTRAGGLQVGTNVTTSFSLSMATTEGSSFTTVSSDRASSAGAHLEGSDTTGVDAQDGSTVSITGSASTNGTIFANNGALIIGNIDDSTGATFTSEDGGIIAVDAAASSGANVTAASSISIGDITLSESATVTSADGSYSGVRGNHSSGLTVQSQDGSISIGSAQTSTNSEIISRIGGISAGNLSSATDSSISTDSGAGLIVANLQSAIESEIVAYTGGIAGLGGANSTNVGPVDVNSGSVAAFEFSNANEVQATVQSGGIAAVEAAFADDLEITVDSGSVLSGSVLGAIGASLVSQRGSLLAAAANSSTNVSLEAKNGGALIVFTTGKSDVDIRSERSLIVGAPADSFSQSFESTVAVLGQAGVANGFDTNKFFGNGLGLTNINATSIFYTTNAGSTTSIDFTPGKGFFIITNNNLSYSGRINYDATRFNQAIYSYSNSSAAAKTITMAPTFANMRPSEGNTLYLTNVGQLLVWEVNGLGSNFYWMSR